MRRREFLGTIGTLAAGWPAVARAQQTIPVIGFINGGSPTELNARAIAFRAGLAERGYVEGQNIAIEYRWGSGRYERLPELALDLVRRGVSAIAATGGMPSVRAAQAATSSIPIIFTMGGDPVSLGLVQSLNRPGGNVTGVTLISGEMVSKRIALLTELLPGVGAVAVLVNATTPVSEAEAARAAVAAQALGLRVMVLRVSSELDFELAFRPLERERVNALLVTTDPVFESRRDRIVALAAHHALPAIYALREYAEAGGLMTYGASINDVYRQAGLYTGRVLKGENPAELPVVQASKYEFVINLRTARALRLQVPATLLATADEVIE
jgi:putative tryptophan/tyrosine transport system substrate-binding protein